MGLKRDDAMQFAAALGLNDRLALRELGKWFIWIFLKKT